MRKSSNNIVILNCKNDLLFFSIKILQFHFLCLYFENIFIDALTMGIQLLIFPELINKFKIFIIFILLHALGYSILPLYLLISLRSNQEMSPKMADIIFINMMEILLRL